MYFLPTAIRIMSSRSPLSSISLSHSFSAFPSSWSAFFLGHHGVWKNKGKEKSREEIAQENSKGSRITRVSFSYYLATIHLCPDTWQIVTTGYVEESRIREIYLACIFYLKLMILKDRKRFISQKKRKAEGQYTASYRRIEWLYNRNNQIRRKANSIHLHAGFSFLFQASSSRNTYIATYSRRTLSHFWSFKIRYTTILNYIKFADPRILRL